MYIIVALVLSILALLMWKRPCWFFHRWELTSEGDIYIRTCVRPGCNEVKRTREGNPLKASMMKRSLEQLRSLELLLNERLREYNNKHPFSDFRRREHHQKDVILTGLVAVQDELRRRSEFRR